MKNLSESLFKDDQLDEAIEFLIPSSVPSFMIPIFKEMYKKLSSEIGNNTIISTANQIKVSNIFDIVYKDFILSILEASEEKSFLVEVGRNDILIPFITMKAEKDPDNPSNIDGSILKTNDRYLWLFIGQTKNEKLFKYLSDYLTGATRFISSNRSIYVQLLPANDYDVLDKVCRALASYI